MHGRSIFGLGEQEAGLELLEDAATQARRVLGKAHPSTTHFLTSWEDAKAQWRTGHHTAMVAKAAAFEEAEEGEAAPDGAMRTLSSLLATTPCTLDSMPLDGLLEAYITLKHALDEASGSGMRESSGREGPLADGGVHAEALRRLDAIVDAADAAAAAAAAAASTGDGGEADEGLSSSGGRRGKKGGRKGGGSGGKGGRRRRGMDDDWEADAVIVGQERPAGAEGGGAEAGTPPSESGSAAARVAVLVKAKIAREAAAGGFSSMRSAYDELGAAAYYKAHGAEYTNPHEPTLCHAIHRALDSWQRLVVPLRRVLDLGCGSGEATAALTSWVGAAECAVEACDPYTHAAYQRRMGRPAHQWSFEDVAAGVLDELPPFDLVISSFALHLVEPSYAYTTLAAIARSSRLLVIATPHKRPVVDPSTGWREAAPEVLHERVRVRLYVSNSARALSLE